MSFSTKHINLIVAPKGTNVNIRQQPTTQSAVLFNRSNKAPEGKTPSAGRTTGDFYKDNAGHTWYKVALYKEYNGQKYGWARNDVIKLFKPKEDNISKEKAQSLIDNLVKSDIQVYKNALLLAPLLDQAEKNGHNISQHKSKYEGLVKRLERRQNKIKTSKLLKWRTGLDKGMTWFKNSFKTYLSTQFGIYGTNPNIGAIPAIVIGAVIGGGIAVAAYFAFRPEYDESKTDLKMSKELEKALSSLTPEEAAKLKNNLEKQVDNAYNTGVSNERFGNIAKILKYGLVIGLAFWGGTKLLQASKAVKQTTNND